jgi:tyrosine phenol-lyase
MQTPADGSAGPLEPYKVKVVERIHRPSRAEREAALTTAGFNLFNLTSDQVFIDLLTDSGTSAMSDRQWAGLMVGDETYAGSRNYAHFESVIRDLTGFPEVIPAHQGRAAENLLFTATLSPGAIVPNNMHFDTTRAHVLRHGATAPNLVVPEAYRLAEEAPFKGNMDLARLRALLEGPDAHRVPLVMMTLTNNTGGGQPVALENLRAVSGLCQAHGKPLYLDMCRWAENAFFIREREPGQSDRSIRAIGRDLFALAQGATMSAKKDGLANIGGFVATRDAALAARLRELLIVFEGFPTYGGLARRDLEAVAIGLEEATDLAYLTHRIEQVRFLADRLTAHGVPILRPVGGHAVYLDVRSFLPHVAAEDLPGQALAIEIYREGGVRTVEIGTVMFGDGTDGNPTLELVRLAIPRRVYSSAHLAYVADTVGAVYRRRESILGVRMTYAPEQLRHFTARFAPIEARPARRAAAPAMPTAAGRETLGGELRPQSKVI